MSLIGWAAGDYLDAGDAADVSGAALTLAAWVYPTSLAANGFVVCKGTIAPNTQYRLALTPNKVSVLAGAGATIITGATAMTANQWSHVAGTYDGAALRAFLNGAQDGSGALAGNIGNTAQPLRIGVRSDATSPFSGRIAEVAVWDVALSAAEIAALAKGVCPLMLRRGHLVGYWPLYGSTPAADLSGAAASAALTGALTKADHAPVGRLAPLGA